MSKIKCGAPTKYLPKYDQEIIELRSIGWTVTEVAVKWKVNKDSIYEWRKVESSFSDAFMRARQAWIGWYFETGRNNLHDVSDREGGRKFNERLYKFLGYAVAGISEKSTCGKIELDPIYYDKDASIDAKQEVLDKALASRSMSVAVHESLSRTLMMSFERKNGLAIKDAYEKMQEIEKQAKL